MSILNEDRKLKNEDRKLKKELSNKDIERAGIVWYLYSDLSQPIQNIKLPCIILYLNTKHAGHWTCILKHKNKIEFFDSLGYKPDAEFSFSNRKLNYKGLPYVSQLLLDYYDHGYEIEFNHHQLQEDARNINTCGRWCIVRIKYGCWELEQFVNYIKCLSRYLKLTLDETIIRLHENATK